MKDKRALCALILAVFAFSAFAQDAKEASKVPRRLLLCVESGRGTYTKEESLVIAKSLTLALVSAGNGLTVIEYAGDSFPPSLEARIDATAKEGADCWLFMKTSGEKAAPVLTVHSYDVLFRTTVMDKSISRQGELSTLQMSRETWADIVPPLADKYGPVNAGLISAGHRLVRVTLIALPGTAVEGLRGESIIVGADGKTEVSLGTPATYVLKASRDGYFPLEQRIFLDSDRTLDLTLEPYSKWSVDLSFFNAFNAGVEATYFFKPGRGFVKLGLTSFFLGLALDSEGPFSGYNLVNLNAQAGFFLSPESSVIRIYMTIGGFLRVVFPNSSPLFDPLSPGGVQLALGVQVPLAARSRFFAEYVPMVYFTDFPDLFRASLGEKDSPFGYIFREDMAFSLANLRFGIRWLL